MDSARVSRGWIKQRTIGLADVDGMLHGVVDLQNDTFGAILAKPGLVPPLNNGVHLKVAL